ncbi:hypothetical protein ACVWXL_000050 [Bradyrhizobium sp. GM22.5]
MPDMKNQRSPAPSGRCPSRGAVEARFVWLGSHPLMVLADREGRQTTADAASGGATLLSDDQIFAAASGLLPNAAMTMHLRLGQFDSKRSAAAL